MSAETIERDAMDEIENTQSKEFLTIIIAGQRFGIPILQVQDVLGEQTIAKIPLAPPEVAGSLNLRGRIVTAIDMRCRLSMEPQSEGEASEMGVVVEHDNELYSLIIDKVGDVMRLKNENFESTPATLDPAWKEFASGIYRLDSELLVILDIPKFLSAVDTE